MNFTLEERIKQYYQGIYNYEKKGYFPKEDTARDVITGAFLGGALIGLSLAEKDTDEMWEKIVYYSMAGDEIVRLIRLNPTLTDVEILSRKAECLPQRVNSWRKMGIWAPYGNGRQDDYYNEGTKKWGKKNADN